MCGIIGYSGEKSARDICLAALESLEYRGYDSAGLALWVEGRVRTIRTAGRLEQLRTRIGESYPDSHCGIGHTRWATHGSPSDTNCHPHRQGGVTLVHNGIIENHQELRHKMEQQGYCFISQTDSEVAAALLDHCQASGISPLEAIVAALKQLEGSYAFAILFDSQPEIIYGVRRGSPLLAASDSSGSFLASDLPAFLGHSREYYLLEEGEIVCAQGAELTFFDQQCHPITKVPRTATWSLEEARKGGYDYFMLKEIYEQPQALRDTVIPRLREGLPDFSTDGLPQGFFAKLRRLHITACGTALYCGLLGKELIEGLARLPVEVAPASEVRYRNPILEKGEAAVIISQSGETADSLAALRLYREHGIPVIAIVNVVDSSIAREADYCLYTHAGPEIAVASTKAYIVQLAMLYLMAILAAGERGLEQRTQMELTEQLLETIAQVPKVLELSQASRDCAAAFVNVQNLFYIGRGLDYPLALEGALKLKEISYIHSEAYPAGELKHGTISLITDGTPIIALATQEGLLPKTLSNLQEARARGARVLLITMEGLAVEDEVWEERLILPQVEGCFAPLLAVVVLQLLAVHTAILRGCDVDKPRNLAKSVTVE